MRSTSDNFSLPLNFLRDEISWHDTISFLPQISIPYNLHYPNPSISYWIHFHFQILWTKYKEKEPAGKETISFLHLSSVLHRMYLCFFSSWSLLRGSINIQAETSGEMYLQRAIKQLLWYGQGDVTSHNHRHRYGYHYPPWHCTRRNCNHRFRVTRNAISATKTHLLFLNTKFFKISMYISRWRFKAAKKERKKYIVFSLHRPLPPSGASLCYSWPNGSRLKRKTLCPWFAAGQDFWDLDGLAWHGRKGQVVVVGVGITLCFLMRPFILVSSVITTLTTIRLHSVPSLQERRKNLKRTSRINWNLFFSILWKGNATDRCRDLVLGWDPPTPCSILAPWSHRE